MPSTLPVLNINLIFSSQATDWSFGLSERSCVLLSINKESIFFSSYDNLDKQLIKSLSLFEKENLFDFSFRNLISSQYMRMDRLSRKMSMKREKLVFMNDVICGSISRKETENSNVRKIRTIALIL
jgi:hypothetical protein